MLEQKVEAYLNRQMISLMDKTVMVGVSGGPDSLALLHFLWKKRESWNMNLIAAHVDHMFRGEESYLEAIFVKEFCAKYDITFEMTQINVQEYIRETGKSTQIAARERRYQFFEEIMVKYDATYMALGHHGDDQIETMLMRMTRGSSGKARAGIPFKRPFSIGEVIRPFLAVNRDEIEAYCLLHELNPRRDPSNDKPYYSRNRFRLNIVPFLKGENPNVHEQFQRLSEEIYQDETFLEELTVQEMNKVLKSRTEDRITLYIDKYLAMPLSLQRRGIQLILNYLYKVRPSSLSALHIDLITALFRSPHPSGKLDFPEGLQIIRSYHLCHFQYGKEEEPPYHIQLEEPGVVSLPNGHSISLDFVTSASCNQGLHTYLINPESIVFPIIIRSRISGDRIQPKGMTGTKKIKDIFIDTKIPQTLRGNWPIVTDGNGTIIWIPNVKKSVFEASHEALNRYLLLTYKTQ
jgi:tRNA(Ile)-lysidine synthase